VKEAPTRGWFREAREGRPGRATESKDFQAGRLIPTPATTFATVGFVRGGTISVWCGAPPSIDRSRIRPDSSARRRGRGGLRGTSFFSVLSSPGGGLADMMKSSGGSTRERNASAPLA